MWASECVCVMWLTLFNRQERLGLLLHWPVVVVVVVARCKVVGRLRNAPT